MKPFIWIIDEEWPNYLPEKKIFNEAFPQYDLRFSSNDYEHDLREFGFRADAVLCQISVDAGAPLIDRFQNCKVLSVYGSGYNNVDVQAAANKGILVTFVPGYCAQDIAEYVIASVLRFQKGIENYHGAVTKGFWGARAVKEPGKRLSSCTLTVAGFGRIGQAVGQKADALGMRVLAYDPYVKKEIFQKYAVRPVSMDEGLEQADYLSIHTPYVPGTPPLFAASAFERMKKTAVVINASRGGVLAQDDLIKAVSSGEIRGAALDVLEKEPPEKDDPVLHTPGILVTPHISYLSEDSLMELQIRAAKNAVCVLTGEKGADIVSGCRK